MTMSFWAFALKAINWQITWHLLLQLHTHRCKPDIMVFSKCKDSFISLNMLFDFASKISQPFATFEFCLNGKATTLAERYVETLNLAIHYKAAQIVGKKRCCDFRICNTWEPLDYKLLRTF